MSQPRWKKVLEADSRSLFVDKTKANEPEAEVQDPLPKGGMLIYRFPIPRLALIEGHLVPREDYAMKAPAVYAEWFSKEIASVASCCGMTTDELCDALCSEDIRERFWAYMALVDYHGAVNFDSYPLERDA